MACPDPDLARRHKSTCLAPASLVAIRKRIESRIERSPRYDAFRSEYCSGSFGEKSSAPSDGITGDVRIMPEGQMKLDRTCYEKD